MLLGESHVGKSHYGGQLLGRLNSGRCELSMEGAADNSDPYVEVVKKLNVGVSAGHTASTTYEESQWRVRDRRGNELELLWPDYAGEQIRKLIDERRVPTEWRTRLKAANGWALMLRPGLMHLVDDPFSRPLASLRDRSLDSGTPVPASAQARVIELLQILLFIRGVSLARPIEVPPLMVMLSCWDEMNEAPGRAPAEVLKERLPMVSSFLTANWHSTKLGIVGVAPVGIELSDKIPNEDFINKGPSRHGFVINADGTQDSDLTLPIAMLAAMVA